LVEIAAILVVLCIVSLAVGLHRMIFTRPSMARARRVATGWRKEKRWAELLAQNMGLEHADRVCQYAGRPYGLTGMALLQYQGVFGLLVFVMFLQVNLLFALITGLMAWYMPRFLLGVLAQQRRTQIALELPAFLDLWGLLVASGEGVETALVEICKRHPDWLLTAEIVRVRLRVSASGLFGESLIQEAKVTGSPEFVAVAEQVSHLADGGGVPSKELARMAEQMREQRVSELVESAGAMAIVGILPKLGAVFLSLSPVLVTIGLTVMRQV
jgi:Flp pilus assembly protein TadB